MTKDTAGPLTPKQQRFVAEYLKDLNGKQAAIRAGYKPSRAEQTASELLATRKVSEAAAAGKSAQLTRADLHADRVLEELGRLAFVDARGFFDAQGNLKPLADLTVDQGACLANYEVMVKNVAAGDGKTDTIHKIRFWDKVRALEHLAKHFGLLVDRVEVSGAITLVEQLQRARQRLEEK